MFTANDLYGFLKHVVSKLIVYQFLNNETDSWLEVLRFFRFITEFINYLSVVILERAFENLVNVRLRVVAITLQFGV